MKIVLCNDGTCVAPKCPVVDVQDHQVIIGEKDNICTRIFLKKKSRITKSKNLFWGKQYLLPNFFFFFTTDMKSRHYSVHRDQLLQ